MPAFRLSTKARADLIDIGRYTQQTWGREQRNRYLSRLDEAFHLLAREPDRGRRCDDIRQGYRKNHLGRHVIFYRLGEKMARVIPQASWPVSSYFHALSCRPHRGNLGHFAPQ